MDVLQEHRDRVAAYRESLARLTVLHQQVHDLLNRRLAIAKEDAADKEVRMEALFKQAEGLQRDIAQLRKKLEPGQR
jgi:predicted  nucleic acid-binding Zn-ribbon protein